MTTETQDIKLALDALEEKVDLRQADPGVLLPNLATLLLSLQRDSEHRPRVHRLLGVVNNRLKLDRDALRELCEARTLAEAKSPPNFTELSKIGRETAVVYAWRGDDRSAAAELLPALAFAELAGNEKEIAKVIAEFGRIELEAQRFKNVAMLFRYLVSQGANSKLPPREMHRVRINLCQALNRLGQYDEVLQNVAALLSELAENETRLQFLTRLEEARALAGLGRFDDAETALVAAEKLQPEKSSAFERSELLQAVTEIQEAGGGDPAIPSLEELVEKFAEQGLVVREAVARRAFANALFKKGEDEKAREALAQGLRSALANNLVEVADEIRADMLKSAGAEHLEELAETIDLIGGANAIERRFVVMARLGQGGAGQVSRAVDLTDGRHVALKKIDLRNLTAAERPGIVNTVKTEYAAAGKVDDPRVARVIDLRMAAGGALYIVQRYVDGPTLRKVYDSAPGPARLLVLLAGVADALILLHGRDIVHRDLKPENVIVTSDERGIERPVLIDLGIALVAGRPDELKHYGTVPYVAPEQVAGQAVTAAADVFALGHMIAEVWGGKLPSHSGFRLPWHKDSPDAMPRPLAELVEEMVAGDPARRPSDLEDVAEVLRDQSQALASA